MKRPKLLAAAFVALMLLVSPYLRGSTTDLDIGSTAIRSVGAVTLDTKVLELGITHSKDQSLAWSVDGACTLTVELAVHDPNDLSAFFWITPADLGFSQANPIVISGAEDDLIALALPVCRRFRVTASGAVDGFVVFNES